MKRVAVLLLGMLPAACSKGADSLEEIARLRGSVERLEASLQEERGRIGSLRVEIEALQKTMGSVSNPDDEKLREKIAEVMQEQRQTMFRGIREGGLFRRRAYLGVQTAEATPEARKAAGLPEGAGGALLENVVADAPAHKAGFRSGDVILAVGTREIREPADLVDAVSNAHAGDRISVKYARKGQAPATLEIVLADAPRGGRPGGPRPPGENPERQTPPAKAPPRVVVPAPEPPAEPAKAPNAPAPAPLIPPPAAP